MATPSTVAPRATTAASRSRRSRQKPGSTRQRRLVALAAGAIVVVLALLIVARLLVPSTPSAPDGPVPASVLAAVTNVPSDTFEQVGRGTARALPTAISADVQRGPNGLPLVTYIGAEYCPYCAAERWALVLALSRFGQFDGLRVSHSAADDIFPNTATFSFVGSTYHSAFFDFDGVELQSNQRSAGAYAPLQAPTPDQERLLQEYDAPPYVPASAAGAIPFVSIANQYVLSGASYDVGILRGLSAEMIANRLSDPTSATTKAIVGSANTLTAALCQVSGNAPADVCSSPTITSLQASLGSASR
jgi:hypothetical protein